MLHVSLTYSYSPRRDPQIISDPSDLGPSDCWRPAAEERERVGVLNRSSPLSHRKETLALGATHGIPWRTTLFNGNSWWMVRISRHKGEIWISICCVLHWQQEGVEPPEHPKHRKVSPKDVSVPVPAQWPFDQGRGKTAKSLWPKPSKRRTTPHGWCTKVPWCSHGKDAPWHSGKQI